MTLGPPIPKDWVARYDPQPADFNVRIRDTFNFLTSPPRLRVVANAVQSITTFVWTVIQLQSVTEDNYSGWTSGTSNFYAAQVPGRYGITFLTQAAISGGNNARVGLQYQVNGSVVGPFEFDQSVSGQSPWGWDCYDEVYLGTGDRVTPMFIHNVGSTISTSTGNPSSMEVVWLSK